MKNLKRHLIFSLIIASATFSSCELDNYDEPNASISGGIYDYETKELVRQDIVSGAQIEYIEHGYNNPETQFQIIKSDGTYMNTLMFANTYTMHLLRGNFVPIEEQEIVVKGNTVLNFDVQPYIRVKNSKIEKVGNKIVASFNIQQTVSNTVQRIGLYAHSQDYVGVNSRAVAVEQDLNVVTNESTVYTLEIDLEANKNELKPGKQYYFIIGALINASEAKLNYAAPIRITI